MGCSSSGGPSKSSMSRATSATLRAAASFASSLPTDSRNGSSRDMRMSETDARMFGRSSKGTFPHIRIGSVPLPHWPESWSSPCGCNTPSRSLRSWLSPQDICADARHWLDTTAQGCPHPCTLHARQRGHSVPQSGCRHSKAPCLRHQSTPCGFPSAAARACHSSLPRPG